jgi:4-hydroxybenzoate polyprenyltransferase
MGLPWIGGHQRAGAGSRQAVGLNRGMAGMWTDIDRTGWVAALPAWLRPYAVLARADRPAGSWLLAWPGVWGILLVRPDARLVALFIVGAFAMRAAGCVVNDMWDRDLDRQVTRTAARPLASGELQLRQAAVFLVVLLSIGLAVLLQLNPLCWALGGLSLVLVVLYPLAKRVTWWPQAVLGVTFGWGASMGYAAASGRWDGTALALHGAAFLWIIGYDTIYAHQDREDDALIGVRSTARLFGARTRLAVKACYLGAIVLLANLAHGWALPALLLPACMLSWQVNTLDINDPVNCLRRFAQNQWVGAAIALALLARWV